MIKKILKKLGFIKEDNYEPPNYFDFQKSNCKLCSNFIIDRTDFWKSQQKEVDIGFCGITKELVSSITPPPCLSMRWIEPYRK